MGIKKILIITLNSTAGLVFGALCSATAFAAATCTYNYDGTTTSWNTPANYLGQALGRMDGTENCYYFTNTGDSPTIRITWVGSPYGGPGIQSYINPGTVSLSNYTINGTPIANSVNIYPMSNGVTYTVAGSYLYNTVTYYLTTDITYNSATGVATFSNGSMSTVLSPGITVSAVSGNTTEAGGAATFTVVLKTQPSADVSIGLSSSNTNEGTVSPSSLTFTNADWATPKTVTVTGVDDDVDDGNVAYSIITAAATSSDGDYNGMNAADVSVTNTDNDVAGITVSAISGNTSEAGGTATFTVVLDSQPTADVSMALSSSNTDEGTVSPSSLTFTNADWATPKTVTVTGIDDLQVDGSVLFSIITDAATSADGNYSGVNPADVTVTNADNDVAGITVSTISGNTSEAGTTATFSVILNTQPSADVVVGLSSSDTTEGTVSPSSLTFTSANWNANQTVTVTGVDDSSVDGNISFSIQTAAATSVDGNYNGLDANDVNVTNTDNDVAGTDSNSDGIMDDDAIALGLDPNALDSDRDGISDAVEVGDPNNPTDTDGDGIIDALEPGSDNNDDTVLAAFITSGTSQALNLSGMGNTVLSIRSTGAGTLIAHPNGTRGIPLYNETDMPVADANYSYPFGLVDFSVTAPGGTGNIVIHLPPSVDIPAGAVVRKLDASNRWVSITATIDATARTITLSLADNDSLDHNPTVGIIRDPVGIAIPTASAGGGGGGGCTLTTDERTDLSLVMMAGMLLLLGAWRRSSR